MAYTKKILEILRPIPNLYFKNEPFEINQKYYDVGFSEKWKV